MIQKLHVSKNLFDISFTKDDYATNVYHWALSGLTPNTKYTCSSNFVQSGTTASIWFGGTGSGANGVSINNPKTMTANANGIIDVYMNHSPSNAYDQIISGTTWIMVNEGSTALPYEPYGDTWNTKSYSKIVDTTQQVTSFPVVVRPMENTIPSWTIKGNLVQDGTPSPSNIIYPSETGERTANLFDYKTVYSSYINANGDIATNASNIKSWNNFTSNDVGKTLTISIYVKTISASYVRVQGYIDGNYITGNNINAGTSGYSTINVTPTSTDDTWRIIYGDDTYVEINQVMVEESSTRTTYQPYGYKLDIKSSNTTTPVYLGEVESTRIIGKYEFTGNESWSLSGSGYFYSTNSFTNYNHKLINQITTKWSHYIAGVNSTNGQHLLNGYACLYCHATSAIASEVYIRDETYSTVADFKAYLAQQYAAGTPVCVWYVLANETTTTLNEPLRKIGNYSDSVSGTNLSVTAQSPTTIDVDTSLKPSEMDLTYTGTKMCKRKKRVNGAWV